MDSAGVGSAGSGCWVGSKGGFGFRVPQISGTIGLGTRVSQLGGHNDKGHNHLESTLAPPHYGKRSWLTVSSCCAMELVWRFFCNAALSVEILLCMET